MNRIISRLLIVVSSVLFLGNVLSEPGFAITISNGAIQIKMDPGQEASSSFVIGNNEGKTLNLKVSAVDWHQTPSGGLKLEAPGSLPRSMESWIDVSPSLFVLNAEGTQEVRFTVNVPEDATGTYWVGLLVEVEDQSNAGGQGEGVGLSIGTNFLVKVFVDTFPGRQPDAQLTGVRHLGLNPLTMEVTFANTGNIQLENVRGRVEIRNFEGNTIKSMPIKEFTVLPGDTRNLHAVDDANLGDTLLPGRYLALAVLDFGNDFLLGGQLVFEIEPLNLIPIGNSTNLPQDLNGDGVFEDINGDGQFSLDDVELLEAYLLSPEIQGNWRAFDFLNDGILNEEDVAFLKRSVQTD